MKAIRQPKQNIFTKLSFGNFRKINKDSLFALIGGESILKLLLHILIILFLESYLILLIKSMLQIMWL